MPTMLLSLLVLLTVLLTMGCPQDQEAAEPERTDFLRYFPTQSGTVMVFRSTNLQTQVEGRLRITLEPRTLWCDLPIIPWHFTKSVVDVYWAPGIDADLRWFTVAPDAYDAAQPAWNAYVWVAGHEQILRGTQAPYRTQLYRSTTVYPPYVLGIKLGTLPAAIRADDGHNYVFEDTQAPICPQPVRPKEDMTGVGAGWWVRWAKTWLTIDPMAQDYPYDGPALLADFVEGGTGPLEEAHWFLVREQWWFVEGLGLMQIASQSWTGGQPPAPGELGESMLRAPQTISIRQQPTPGLLAGKKGLGITP